MRHHTTLVAAALVLVLGAPAAQAQEDGVEAEAMAAYIAAATPGAQHEMLARLAGTYEATSTVWLDLAAPPSVSHGKSVKHVMLDGRFLVEHYEGEMMAQPFSGIGITGYDNVAQEFVSTWMDTFGTGILSMSGDMDGDGGLVVEGPYVDPASGETKTFRGVTTLTEDGHKFVAYDVMQDGSSVKTMEITYVRTGPAMTEHGDEGHEEHGEEHEAAEEDHEMAPESGGGR